MIFPLSPKFQLGTKEVPSTLGTSMRIGVSAAIEGLDWIDRVGTLTIDTGACSVQTYATPEALRGMAAAMTAAAEQVEARIGVAA